MNPLKRLILPVLLLIALIAAGVSGYVFIEGWPVLDAIYMVVITLSTVGFREVHALNAAGKLLTMGIIICGVGTAVYLLGQIIEIIVEGEIAGFRRKKDMDKIISERKDHYIICGYGRVGHQVAHELLSEGKTFVVIDNKPETAVELNGSKIPHIIGDITSDEKLEEAGISSAIGLIACADSDISNVFVTLSARALNPKLFIVARASQKETQEKLKKAGADRVISPYFIAGRRMAAMAVKPVAVDFFDTIMHSEHLELDMGEFCIKETSKLANKSLSESEIRQVSGAYILSIRKSTGNFVLQPLANTILEAGDIIVAIGMPKQLELLGKMV
ncbi:MAG: TrkA-N domain-containing protein [Candidatus Saganbacteria bacterium]|uniref:TrkA-N domain-containing protein n=1 Tax=Candidatus Saganbacteria bacterium TaxID=2575572 RepID=A0A833NZA5_UNCSA|nr:MAG: TrkA-N domain-containing protein [Candidatus Saganbacteria bacterium]